MNSLIIRSFTGLVYASVILISLFYDAKLFSFIILCFSLLAIFEFQKLLLLKNITPYILLGFLCFYFLREEINDNIIKIILFVTLASHLLMLKWLFSEAYEKKWITISLTYGYLVFSCFFIILIPYSNNEYNPKLMLFVFTLNWVNNSFAYFFGKKFGKTKLLSRVSPNKSWEGFISGLFFSLFTGFIFFKSEINIKSFQIIIFSILIPVLATLGDLVQSKIKREAGVKDSGNILPGHGGFYDRMDSIIFISPWAYFILNQF